MQALALAYAIPIAVSLLNRREQVLKARWNLGRVIGPVVNGVALAWIAFELVLFSMPTALPVTAVSMNYASVVLVGFGVIAAAWYAVHSRKCEYFLFISFSLSLSCLGTWFGFVEVELWFGSIETLLLTVWIDSVSWPAGFGRVVSKIWVGEMGWMILSSLAYMEDCREEKVRLLVFFLLDLLGK